MHKIIISGTIGRDAEVKSFENFDIISFPLAVSENFKKNGEWQKKTEWFECQIFRETAGEKTARNIKKGSVVIVEGKASSSAWVNKDGKATSALRVKVEKFEIAKFADSMPVEMKENHEAKIDDDSPF